MNLPGVGGAAVDAASSEVGGLVCELAVPGCGKGGRDVGKPCTIRAHISTRREAMWKRLMVHFVTIILTTTHRLLEFNRRLTVNN